MPPNATSTMKVKVPPKGRGQKKEDKHEQGKTQGKIYRAKIEGKSQGKGKGKGKTTNYYFPVGGVHFHVSMYDVAIGLKIQVYSRKGVQANTENMI